MSDRYITDFAQANLCDACKAEGKTTLATHGITDCRQTPNGDWNELPPRNGCDEHPVTSRISMSDGRVLSFEEWLRENKS